MLAESPWPEHNIDQVMPLMRRAAATGRSQVVAIGVAQEFQRVFTGTKDQTPTGAVWFSYNPTERRVTCYLYRFRLCAGYVTCDLAEWVACGKIAVRVCSSLVLDHGQVFGWLVLLGRS